MKMQLPTDLSILDEEGRASAAKTKEKAAAVGLSYRPGNHFGESCLNSISGVRQESVVATTVVELYLLSKESLEKIFSYTPLEERAVLKLNLLSRNGNVWHSFDEQESTPKRQTSVKSSSRLTISPTSFLRTKSQRFTVTTQVSAERKSQRSTHIARNTRLRSFSAEAGAQVLRTRVTLESPSLEKIHEHGRADNEGHSFMNALHAARLFQDGEVIVERDDTRSDSESDSTSSCYGHRSSFSNDAA